MGNKDGKMKYFTLMEQLKEDIVTGNIQPGEQLPSENQLALQYQMSRHTVRKALAILAGDGYVEARHGKGTFCSQRLRHMKKSRNIAVITTYISDYIFPRLIQGIDRVLTEQGYSIVLKNTGNSQRREALCLEDILEKDIDGIIIEPSKSQLYCPHMHLYEKLEEYDIPYLFIQGLYPQMQDKPHILMNDCEGGYRLTKHLVEIGRRSIVGIFKADDSQGKERHKGYVKALQEAGLAYDPEMVIWFHTEDRRQKPAGTLLMMIRAGISFDAVVCYNDQIAFEVMKTLEQAQRSVPGQVAVTGYDNSFIAQNGRVKLTTIAHPQEKLGELAATLMLELIGRQGDESKERVCPRLIQPELIIRESTVGTAADA